VLRRAPGAPKALLGELGRPLELPQTGSGGSGTAVGTCAIERETLPVIAGLCREAL
jgi:hypothetical protein